MLGWPDRDPEYAYQNEPCEVGSAPTANNWDRLIGADGAPGSTTHSRQKWVASLEELGSAQATLDEAPVRHEWKLSPESGKGSDVELNQEAAIAKAQAAGFEVVQSDEHTVLLDIDDQQSMRRYDRMMEIIPKHVPIVEAERWASKDGGLHVKLRVAESTTPLERLLLQACMGSDPVKEFLGMVRIKQGIPNPTLLFKPTVGK